MPFYLLGQDVVIVGKESGELRDFKVTVRVIDDITGESLIGATVIIPESNLQGITNENGNIYFTLIRADYPIQVRYVGYEPLNFKFRVINDGRLLIRMREVNLELDNIVIYGRDPEQNIKSTDMGAATLSISSLKEMPAFMGEIDIIKSMATLPGVSQVGEAAAGFNVRGGGQDQNLILYAGAPIYNPSHLFGVFTAFNADAISNVVLNKSVVPAKFGGRGSSIMEITTRGGNLNKWNTDLMLSTFSAKASFDGPIVKDRVSALIAARGSYVNWLLGSLSNPDLRNSAANFYDMNVILTGAINDKNIITYSFYNSYDDFALASDTTISWTNRSHSLRYQSTLSDKLDMDITAYSTLYEFTIFNQSGINNFDLNSGITDIGGKINFVYQLNPKNKINFGGESKILTIQPGELVPSVNSNILAKKVQEENGRESAVYFQHEVDVSDKFAFSYGARYDMYQYFGGRLVNQYEEARPRNLGSVTGTIAYDEGELIKNYNGLSPRLSVRYSLSDKSSIKAGYNKMYQFIHLISNTATIAPTDFWKLSDQYLRPQIVDQYSVGFYKNLKGNIYETSVEVYYKDLQNIVEYKDGANLILQNSLETELVSGIGKAYGIEFFLKKNVGRLTGWAGYTYSRTLRQVVSPFEEEAINNGNWYPSNFDKPHDLTLVWNYKMGSFTSFSGTFSYSTGRPVTFPEAKFDYSTNVLAFFDQRNLQRIPDFHRLDLSLNFNLNTTKKLWAGDWTFTVMNVYGRRNPFSIFFNDVSGLPPQAFRLSILGVPIPTLSYALKF